MKVLDLFSGIGGFSLGLERAGMETIAFCEIDAYCRAVLARHWPNVPTYEDVRTLPSEQFRAVDVIAGGWPCQPYSQAARGRNVHPDMWPEFLRIIQQCVPRWVVGENVSGEDHIEQAAVDLRDLQYAVWQIRFRIPFRGHLRDRTYLVAYANGNGEPSFSIDGQMAGLCPYAVEHPEDHPEIMGMDDGVPRRVDRLRALGNAVVPQVVEVIGRAIMEAEDEHPALPGMSTAR